MMVYQWTQLGINEITNLYLYGQLTTPTDLSDSAWIRQSEVGPKDPALTSISLDAVSYMSTGPGRFASGAQLSIVALFMEGIYSNFQKTGARQTYSVSDVIDRVLGGDDKFVLHQANFDDGKSDYLSRSYIYNSCGFKIDGNAVFVIEADGTRHIENYRLLPFNDNFDFESNNIVSKIANIYLKERIDPSSIGRRVDIEFDSTSKTQIPTIDYTQATYQQERQKYHDSFGLTNSTRLWSEREGLLKGLWDSGVIRFLDGQNRPIVYGTDEADYLYASSAAVRPTLKSYYQNGVVAVTGDGDDHLYGSVGSDSLHGPSGSE